MRLETAVQGVLDYLKNSLPAYIDKWNSGIEDGITLDYPNKFLLENFPDNSVDVCASLNTTNINYQGAEFGLQFCEVSFVLSIDLKSNSYEKVSKRLLRWTDLLTNMFFDDLTLGNSVVISGVTNATKSATEAYGWLDLQFTATLELLESAQ